jgi:hypothetical protein
VYPLRVAEHAAKRQRPEARARGLRVAEERRARRGGAVAVELAASRQQRQPTRHAGGTVEMSLRRSWQLDGLKTPTSVPKRLPSCRRQWLLGRAESRLSQRPGPRYPRPTSAKRGRGQRRRVCYARVPRPPPSSGRSHWHWPATCPSPGRQVLARRPQRGLRSVHTRPEADTEMAVDSRLQLPGPWWPGASHGLRGHITPRRLKPNEVDAGKLTQSVRERRTWPSRRRWRRRGSSATP